MRYAPDTSQLAEPDRSVVQCLWVSCVTATVATLAIAAVGLFGNACVISIHRRLNRKLRSPMNILIIQLSTLDSIFLLGSLILQARQTTGSNYCSVLWIVLVTMGNFVIHTSRFARNWTTVYIAVSRCVAIIKPLGNINNRSIHRTRRWCCAILLVAVVASLDSLVLPYEWSLSCSVSYLNDTNNSTTSSTIAYRLVNDSQDYESENAMGNMAHEIEVDEEQDADIMSCGSPLCRLLQFYVTVCHNDAYSCGLLLRFALFEQGGPFLLLLVLNVVLCVAICVKGRKMKKHRSRRMDGRIVLRETLITIALVTNFLIMESLVSFFELFGAAYSLGRYAWLCNQDDQQTAFGALVSQGGDLLAVINSGMDFFLYCWISRRFRVAFVNLMTRSASFRRQLTPSTNTWL